jgi:hypothetical protein
MEPARDGQDSPMWLAFLIIVGLVLCFLGLVTGLVWIAVPAILLIAAGLAFYFATVRRGDSEVGHIQSGPDGPREPVEHTPGGPAHRDLGPAHPGQEKMTP